MVQGRVRGRLGDRGRRERGRGTLCPVCLDEIREDDESESGETWKG